MKRLMKWSGTLGRIIVLSWMAYMKTNKNDGDEEGGRCSSRKLTSWWSQLMSSRNLGGGNGGGGSGSRDIIIDHQVLNSLTTIWVRVVAILHTAAYFAQHGQCTPCKQCHVAWRIDEWWRYYYTTTAEESESTTSPSEYCFCRNCCSIGRPYYDMDAVCQVWKLRQ